MMNKKTEYVRVKYARVLTSNQLLDIDGEGCIPKEHAMQKGVKKLVFSAKFQKLAPSAIRTSASIVHI